MKRLDCEFVEYLILHVYALHQERKPFCFHNMVINEGFIDAAVLLFLWETYGSFHDEKKAPRSPLLAERITYDL